MKTKPLSQRAIGRALGLSSASMTKLTKQGMPIDSVESARAWRAENIVPRVNTKPVDPTLPRPSPEAAGDLPSYEVSRAKREAAEAQIAELKMRELEGELVRLEGVKRVWAEAISNVRDAMLQLPARIGPLVAAESDLPICTNIIETAVHQALEALASGAFKRGAT